MAEARAVARRINDHCLIGLYSVESRDREPAKPHTTTCHATVPHPHIQLQSPSHAYHACAHAAYHSQLLSCLLPPAYFPANRPLSVHAHSEGERHAAPTRARARRPLHATLAATLVRVRAATNAVSALLPPAQSKYARAGGASLALAGPAGPSQRGGNPTALDLSPLGSRRRRHRQCDTPPSSRELAARESVWFGSPC